MSNTNVFVSTITSKGQITIPAGVRRHLGVKEHDKVTFVIDSDDGVVRIQTARYPNVASLAGAAGRLKKPVSWSEMRKIAREDAFEAARDTRIE